MQGHVGIRRIGVECLPDHQHGLAMGILALAQEVHVCRQRNIPGDFLPDEMESVRGKPHVFAAAGKRIALPAGVVLDRARMEDRAHVAVPFEDSDGLSSRSGVEFCPHARNKQRARQ